MQFVTPLSPLHEMLAFTLDENNYMRFFQSHFTFNSFHQQINILLIRDGIRTLADVVIAYPTQVDLLS
jgi:hypothetical protein